VTLELTVVDAFTDRPFSGNPAAVAVVDRFPEERHMQEVAREMALSETAFCVARADGDHDLRWFTPTVEVDLCGHATLATAHVLGGTARFHTRSGVLACESGSDATVVMDFPGVPPVPAEVPPAIGLTGVQSYALAGGDSLVELPDADTVRNLVPDLASLAALGTRAVVVTAPGDRPGIDCVSRVFAPNVGIPEDPVTGSAHCVLAVHWGERLGRDSLVGEQASARGGTVGMQRRGDRVLLRGQAVTVSRVSFVA
jgi:predicted PhzF superfamily epimerase YddE/YHI9